jgi:hypothetical protein
VRYAGRGRHGCPSRTILKTATPDPGDLDLLGTITSTGIGESLLPAHHVVHLAFDLTAATCAETVPGFTLHRPKE